MAELTCTNIEWVLIIISTVGFLIAAFSFISVRRSCYALLLIREALHKAIEHQCDLKTQENIMKEVNNIIRGEQ